MSDCDSDGDRIVKIRGESSQKLSHQKQKFRESWKSVPEFKNWLEPLKMNKYKAYCRYCKIQIVSELSTLKKHSKSNKHRENAIAVSNSCSIVSSFTNILQKTTEAEEIKSAEIKLCGFISEHNISLNSIDHLTDILKECFPDSKIAKGLNLGRTKATSIIKNVVGKCHKDVLITLLKSNCFSVIIDESTDVGTLKTLCICVRYFNQHTCKVESTFWSLIQLFTDSKSANEGATANSIYSEVINSFGIHNIPLGNIIGFASDGCNTMMGNWNSVASRFKSDFPGVFIQKCICHSLHLCASEACKVLPRRCEDLSRDVYNYFKSSCKRISQFKEFQTFCDVEPHKILRPSQTRWLSLESVISRILEQWEPLKMFFRLQRYEEKLASAEKIYEYLNDPLILLFYNFLKWVLPKFTVLNKLFQSENIVLTSMHRKMEEIYTELIFAYMVQTNKPLEVAPDDSSKFSVYEQMYLGIGVMNELRKPEVSSNRKMLKEFYDKCRQFLIIACQQIRKRYNFDCSILKNIQYLSPQNALENNRLGSLFSFFDGVPRIANRYSETDLQMIDDEWRKLAIAKIDLSVKQKNVEDFWVYFYNWEIEGEYKYKKIAMFVLQVISLPHSSAECERLFSKVNLIKTKIRNKLQTETLNGLLLSSQHVKKTTCVNFKPTKEMIDSMNITMYQKIDQKTGIDDLDVEITEL